ncbi:hypothetical protein TNCV_2123501 [Trichonephila clavipes]|nr:hypothetical protein TNCV_2123501 [Trichonephila clavipes]
MHVGDLPVIVRIGIGGMQKYWIDKMIREIITEVHTVIGPRGTMVNQGFEHRNRNNRSDHRFENNSGRNQFRNRDPSENFNRGDRRQGGRLNYFNVKVDQNDQSQI